MNKKLLAVAGGVWLLAAAGAGPGLGAQQHSYTPAEIEEGRKLYEANCGGCHRDTGNGITGVELFGQIRRATSDEGIAAIIRQGIPGTGMPPHNYTEQQAMSVVAFLRSMATSAPAPAAPPGGRAAGAAPVPPTTPNAGPVAPGSLPTPPPAGARAAGAGPVAAPAIPAHLAGGDAARGKTIFEGKGGCVKCHRANGAGGTGGPDLSAIGQVRPARGFDPGGPNVLAIERSILDPDADVAIPHRVFEVVTTKGVTTRGRLLNQDTFSVQLLDTNEQLRSFAKTDLKQFGFLPSPMPSYRGRLTAPEMADLISYLLTLKGQS